MVADVLTEPMPANAGPAALRLAERLERGELVYHPVCPFALPAEADRAFLAGQALAGRTHKNISYDPATGRVAGFLWRDEAQAEQLRQVLVAFSQAVTGWLGQALPR